MEYLLSVLFWVLGGVIGLLLVVVAAFWLSLRLGLFGSPLDDVISRSPGQSSFASVVVPSVSLVMAVYLTLKYADRLWVL